MGINIFKIFRIFIYYIKAQQTLVIHHRGPKCRYLYLAGPTLVDNYGQVHTNIHFRCVIKCEPGLHHKHTR